MNSESGENVHVPNTNETNVTKKSNVKSPSSGNSKNTKAIKKEPAASSQVGDATPTENDPDIGSASKKTRTSEVRTSEVLDISSNEKSNISVDSNKNTKKLNMNVCARAECSKELDKHVKKGQGFNYSSNIFCSERCYVLVAPTIIKEMHEYR